MIKKQTEPAGPQRQKVVSSRRGVHRAEQSGRAAESGELRRLYLKRLSLAERSKLTRKKSRVERMSGKEEDPQKCRGCALKSAAGGGEDGSRRSAEGEEAQICEPRAPPGPAAPSGWSFFLLFFLISIQAPSFPSLE